MTQQITIQPLSADEFAAYGDVIEALGDPTYMITGDMCGRYHDLATLDFALEGRAGISLFDSKPYAMPLTLDMVERHPLGSQAFLPMSNVPYLVIVASDNNGVPGAPRAFIAGEGQGVNYHRGTWHGVLTPLDRPARFAVIDRIGDGNNLETYRFEQPYLITSSYS
jgi:ureidoglycolate lyase